MKQTIVALIRPKLNLSQKESQAAHLIEHSLIVPERLKRMGVSDAFYSKNIIFHGGTVNDFYLCEYYIVRANASEEIASLLKKYKNELFINEDEFSRIKSSLIEEILERKGEFIDVGEQLAKAIYEPGSPSIRNQWDDLKSVSGLTYGSMLDIFNKYNKDISVLELSFDNYKLDRLPIIEKNNIKLHNKSIKLQHPWQSPGSVDTYIIVPLPKNENPLITPLYCRSLTDYQFGLLFGDLRNKLGLVYDICVDIDYNASTLEIYFVCNEKNSDIVSDQIKKSLKEYENFIQNNLEFIKGRLKLDIELDWGNIQDQCLNTIDRVVSGGIAETPISLLGKIDSICAKDLARFNTEYLKLLQNTPIVIKRRHGKTLKTEL